MTLPLQTDRIKDSLMTQQLPTDCILKWAKERSNEVYLRQIINRQFVDFTYAEVADKALRLVSALRAQGFQPGDRIALMSKNCAEWFITDLALMLGSYISVPIFPTAGPETVEHCLTHSESKALLIGKLDDSKAINTVLAGMPDLFTVNFDYPSAPKCQYGFNEFIAKYKPSEERPNHQPNDIMSIVYTSGTSGLPKGAMLSYGAFSWSVQRLVDHIGMQDGERLFSYLPLAHITERVYIFGSSVIAGMQVAFPESLDTFIDDVKMHRPTLFISVPRLWTLFQQRILEKLPQGKLNILLKIPFVSGVIKRKLADGLGLNKARVLGCGSAPISPALLRWYENVGLKITEAWGMTESFAYSTLNHPFRSDKIGTVGNAGPGIEVKVSDNEEILVRGMGLFSGYYKNEEATAKMFDSDGWLHTGDIGSIDDEGYLTIQGRINDTFKTAKGKFVSPVPIEKRIFELANIELMCVIGSGLPAPILLAIPHQFQNFDRERYEKTAKRVIDTINKELESHAKIKGVLMIEDPWSVENGILTPTLKIKRHVLEKKYHDIGSHWPKDKLVQWEDNLS
ncbi:AMP-dependent synthetase [Photobacterium aquae]|uniref:AMP-dependent synthetase n=2 Tax=Photobacterium aquae TaxID=1195763 RepID=A0A0J1GWY1_9GAMM|nr:AMP-dependent synthetase [Photobacterium aquae]